MSLFDQINTAANSNEAVTNEKHLPIVTFEDIAPGKHKVKVDVGGGKHPNGGIHARNKPTPDWQYWSRPFKNWNSSRKSAKEYLAFIRTLMDFE